ncbi:MAG: methyl-accepting chemotaxis protein [Chloroflexaceae bacterium]|nr:methyl-accepting chemotaxis protein [Chloroflexaceae bacterium]
MHQSAEHVMGAFPEHSLLRDNLGVMRLLIAGGIVVVGLFWAVTIGLWMFQTVGSVFSVVASLIAVLALLVYLGAYYLLRRGQTLTSRRVVFFGMLLGAAFAVFLLGGATGPLVMLFFIPVISAGLMGHGRDGLHIAAGAILIYAVMFGIERSGLYQPILLPDWIYLFNFVITGVFLAVVAWLSGRDLLQVVAQSQERAEELLRKTEQLLEKNIQQVELGSELAAAAQELQVASQQQASGATEQASAVAQVSSTIEELGSTARQIAQAAEQVAQAAQQTLENLSSGQDAVDESIHAMERIRGRVSDVTTRVLSLGERSQQIGEIIDLIDDISDETHLLALNAAIEAAGAGEHGRRFAVVAAEVKSLANRTLAAAKEVKGVIAEIRQATSAAVLAAEEGSKEVERGVELAHRAGQIMDNIVMVAERTAQSAAEIGLATAQQQSASEQVVETMREIAEVARQTAFGSRQMAESAATLTAIADRLHGIAVEEREP